MVMQEPEGGQDSGGARAGACQCSVNVPPDFAKCNAFNFELEQGFSNMQLEWLGDSSSSESRSPAGTSSRTSSIS